MKYNININQLAMSELSNNMDVIDAAILDYLTFVCKSSNERIENKRIKNDQGSWTWVDLSTLLSDMPLLRISSLNAISARIKKIEKNSFLKTLRHRVKGHIRLYIQLEDKVESLYVKKERIESLYVEKDSTIREKGQGWQKPIRETAPIITLTNNYNKNRLWADAPLEISNKKKIKPKKVIGPKTPEFLGSEINEVIQILSPLNPDWKSWFKPGAQRTSVMKLMQFVKTDGNDLNKLVDKVMVSRGKQYEVQIYSPCDMVEKYAKLVTKRRKAIELSSENIITKGRYEDSFKEMADLKKKKEEEYRLKTL